MQECKYTKKMCPPQEFRKVENLTYAQILQLFGAKLSNFLLRHKIFALDDQHEDVQIPFKVGGLPSSR